MVIVGQPNTGKSLLGKIGAALVGGIHRVAVYSSLSSSKLADFSLSSTILTWRTGQAGNVCRHLLQRFAEIQNVWQHYVI